jgi:FlaA1/EpsC-like NDP-sugar epimerase
MSTSELRSTPPAMLSTVHLALARLDATALLGRPEVVIDWSGAADVLRGRRVLVTGAGGSVGVPLVERLLALGPAAIVLLDNHEDSLFRLYRRVSWAGGAPPAARPATHLVLGDVRNRAKLAAIFERWQPQVVFHLAAYKHVHFGEVQPDEPISVNVLATHALVETALAHGVEVFVYTSSDKAVNPTGIYGATKRLAELVVRWGGQRAAGRFVVVRFVNVLGTRGSVIETFLEQLAADQPLTITDPAMTRYWMSMREAVDLVLAAAAAGPPGSTLLADPGPPVGILEMAERVRALAGRAEAARVQVVGVRPGERLAEELASPNERLVPGPAAGLTAVEHCAGDALLAAVPECVATLQSALDRDAPALAAHLMALARELV